MSDETRTLDEVLDGERIAMLVTSDQRARPMAILDREGATLWFLTGRDADWVAGLRPAERVTLAVSHPEDAVFVSLSGTARTSTDADRLEQLWNPGMEAWFEGKDDPNLVALAVDVEEGEYWDGPGSGIGRTLRGIAGVVTGDGRRTMGDKGSVDPR